jgi:hypothetical protein
VKKLSEKPVLIEVIVYTEVVPVSLYVDQLQQIHAQAKQAGCTPDKIIRDAIDDYLERNVEKK